jgi:hypothetical protein
MTGDRYDPWGLSADETSSTRRQALESRLDEIAAEISRLRRERAEAIEEFRAFTSRSAAAAAADASSRDSSPAPHTEPPVRHSMGTLETFAAELADRGSQASSRIAPFVARQPQPRTDRSSFFPPRRRPGRFLRLVVPALLLAALGASVPSLVTRWTLAPPSSPPGPGPSGPQTAGRPSPADADASPTARVAEPAPQPVGTSGALTTRPLMLELTASREVWLRSRLDDGPASARVLAAAEVVRFEADRYVEVRVGDAGAITLRVNGVDRGPMGRDGEVLTRRFEADPERSKF